MMFNQRCARVVCIVISLACQLTAHADEVARRSYSEIVAPLSHDHIHGFVDVFRDIPHGKVWLSVTEFDTPFLLVGSVPYGLGSNDLGIDRGVAGDTKVVHFEKHGTRLFLVQENTHFIASSANADERHSVTQAFAAAVLWSGEIAA